MNISSTRYVVIRGWFGACRVPVEVVRKMARRTRIKLLCDCAKGKAGEQRSVAHDVVRVATEPLTGPVLLGER